MSDEANNTSIAKHRIPLNAPLPTPTSPAAPFCIDQAAYQTSVAGMNAKVAFDGTNYLVVWAQQRPLSNSKYNHELRAARITPAGQILDPNGFPVGPAANKYNTFNVAYSGQVYLVVWEEDRLYFNPTTRPYSVIRAVLVSPAGTVLSPSPWRCEAFHSQVTG